MKYALILLMLGVTACSKDLTDDGVEVNWKQPIKPAPDTILIPVPPHPDAHELGMANKANG